MATVRKFIICGKNKIPIDFPVRLFCNLGRCNGKRRFFSSADNIIMRIEKPNRILAACLGFKSVDRIRQKIKAYKMGIKAVSK